MSDVASRTALGRRAHHRRRTSRLERCEGPRGQRPRDARARGAVETRDSKGTGQIGDEQPPPTLSDLSWGRREPEQIEASAPEALHHRARDVRFTPVPATSASPPCPRRFLLRSPSADLSRQNFSRADVLPRPLPLPPSRRFL